MYAYSYKYKVWPSVTLPWTNSNTNIISEIVIMTDSIDYETVDDIKYKMLQ